MKSIQNSSETLREVKSHFGHWDRWQVLLSSSTGLKDHLQCHIFSKIQVGLTDTCSHKYSPDEIRSTECPVHLFKGNDLQMICTSIICCPIFELPEWMRRNQIVVGRIGTSWHLMEQEYREAWCCQSFQQQAETGFYDWRVIFVNVWLMSEASSCRWRTDGNRSFFSDGFSTRSAKNAWENRQKSNRSIHNS